MYIKGVVDQPIGRRVPRDSFENIKVNEFRMLRTRLDVLAHIWPTGHNSGRFDLFAKGNMVLDSHESTG